MRIRVAAVQFQFQPVREFAGFARQVERYVEAAEEAQAHFVLFPEYVTAPLLSIPDGQGKLPPVSALSHFTEQYRGLFTILAEKTGMHLIGGTHILGDGDRLYNVAHVFYPNGEISEQVKLHLTPTEAKAWRMTAGGRIHVFETGSCSIAVPVGYDIEFPEIARIVRAKGADVLFCPYHARDQYAYQRIRHSCHARAIENHVYVVMVGAVGALPEVERFRSSYGQAMVITPNDISFPDQGILAAGDRHADMVVVAELDLEMLARVRQEGAVTPWSDRRTDLYPDY